MNSNDVPLDEAQALKALTALLAYLTQHCCQGEACALVVHIVNRSKGWYERGAAVQG